MGIACLVKRAQVRRCPAGQHIGATAERGHRRGGEAIAFGETRSLRDARPLKRSFDDVDNALQLGEQLHEGAVAAGGAGWTFRRRRVRLPGGPLGVSRRLDQPRQLPIVHAHRFDQMGDGQAGLRRLLAQHDAFEARPEEDTGQRRDESGHDPPSHAGGNGGGGCGDRHRDHEGEEHAGLRRRQVAAEDPAECDRETDDEHHGGRESSRDRYQRADRDEECADGGARQVGDRPRRSLTAEIRHDEEGETAKDGEDDVLPTVKDKDGESQDRWDDDGGACRAP